MAWESTAVLHTHSEMFQYINVRSQSTIIDGKYAVCIWSYDIYLCQLCFNSDIYCTLDVVTNATTNENYPFGYKISE